MHDARARARARGGRAERRQRARAGRRGRRARASTGSLTTSVIRTTYRAWAQVWRSRLLTIGVDTGLIRGERRRYIDWAR